MKKISKFIVKRYKIIFIIFILLAILSAIMATTVKINYSMQNYMPSDSESMQSIDMMSKEFDEPIPNLRIALKNISVSEVLEKIEKLKNMDEIKLVMWLDTFINPYIPVHMISKGLLDAYYKDETALLNVAIETHNSKEALDKIKSMLPEDTAYDGTLVTEAAAQNSVNSEIGSITMYILPIGVLILLLAVSSWIEPILLLASIGVAIVLNMGTNVFVGEVSFVTQAVSGILQLAVSMDYAIFLLHEFENRKKLCEDKDEALAQAIEKSASSVISSALTTVFGFIVLVFMRFRLGTDLGIVLAKGVAFSLISVIFFLPAMIKIFMKLIDKTKHKSFLPNFKPLSKFVVNNRWIMIIILLIAPIAFLGQLRNDFTYGMGDRGAETRESIDFKYIQDKFGENVQIVILVKKGDLAKENQMISDLKELNLVQSVTSYTEQVGQFIPINIPPSNAIKSLMSENYSRIILNTISPLEGERAFTFVDKIDEIVNKYYSEHRLIGQPVVMREMAEIIKKDNSIVNLLAIISIALVIMFNFKSISIPLILVLTIEISIWINLSIPYFKSTNLSFIGYLVISSIQLGATVDYAILYTSKYLELRQKYDKKEALIQTGASVYVSLIPPALILTAAGYLLQFTSSISIVSELGNVLGRGAILSLTMVVILLPILLYYLDKIVEKTTINSNFKKG